MEKRLSARAEVGPSLSRSLFSLRTPPTPSFNELRGLRVRWRRLHAQVRAAEEARRGGAARACPSVGASAKAKRAFRARRECGVVFSRTARLSHPSSLPLTQPRRRRRRLHHAGREGKRGRAPAQERKRRELPPVSPFKIGRRRFSLSSLLSILDPGLQLPVPARGDHQAAVRRELRNERERAAAGRRKEKHNSRPFFFERRGIISRPALSLSLPIRQPTASSPWKTTSSWMARPSRT